jgi:quinol monooxygenase YgiN
VIAAVFEARMRREQAEQLAELMREARPTRPEGVLAAALMVDGDLVQLVAYWRDRATFDRYVSTVDVPRGTELMRKVGVEPELRIVETLELG